MGNSRMFAHGLATLGLTVLGLADVAASLCALPAVLSIGVWDAGRPTIILALRAVLWAAPGILGLWLLAAVCFGGALAIAFRLRWARALATLLGGVHLAYGPLVGPLAIALWSLYAHHGERAGGQE